MSSESKQRMILECPVWLLAVCVCRDMSWSASAKEVWVEIGLTIWTVQVALFCALIAGV